MFNSSTQKISVRGITKAVSERSAEVKTTEPRNRRQILNGEFAA
jgi:hypothetical protein